MIPTDVLRKVGGFCPLFYHYGEDKDFVNRLHYHHYIVGYSPKVFGNHDREYRPMTHEGFLRTEYAFTQYAGKSSGECPFASSERARKMRNRTPDA